MSYRIEHDSLGTVEVPAEAYYGAQTQRALQNFQLSGLVMPRAFIRALGLIKWAAAEVNAELGLVDTEGAGGIHGLVDEGEDIKVRAVGLDRALDELGGDRVHAATTLIALQWLALHRAELAERWK